MADNDSRPHCDAPGCQFTRRQWAALRAWLAVPDSLPDDRVGDALIVALAADRVVGGEVEYLSYCGQFGWQPDDAGPWDGD